MPGDLVDSLIHALRGADSLGSLLRVDRDVDEAIARQEKAIQDRPAEFQKGLFGDEPRPPKQGTLEFDRVSARRSLLDRLESFLGRHTGSDDLALRFAGEQLAAGVRFVRMAREGTYDLFVGNAPYQDTTKIERIDSLMDSYPVGKRNLYSAFLVRGLEFARDGGFSALLTIRDWMFLDRFKELRQHLLETFALRSLHDMASGAFEEIPTAQVVVTVASSIFQRTPPDGDAVALRVFQPQTVTSVGETERKRAATECQATFHKFNPGTLVTVPDWPLIYWWTRCTPWPAPTAEPTS